MRRAEEFEQLRPLLFAIAYRILGSVSEAEDAVQESWLRFEADRRERAELAERFFDAFRDGDVDGLRELLAADVHMVGDSGGKAPQWGEGIFGAENVARVLAAIVAPFVRIGGVVEPREVNGQPGAIFRDRDGRILNTWTLDVLDGQIQMIRAVLNPDKLAHLGPVADAWALIHEANQARRPTE